MVPVIQNLAASSANTIWRSAHQRECPQAFINDMVAKAHDWPSSLWTLTKARAKELLSQVQDLPAADRAEVAKLLELPVEAFSRRVCDAQATAARRVRSMIPDHVDHAVALDMVAAFIEGTINDLETADRVAAAMRFDDSPYVAQHFATG